MTAPRILVVEDEVIVALHLRQQLKKLGYDTPAAAASGDQALREIEAARPDLVLMDINIKGKIDGIATASRIPAELRIPVIYLTAYSEDATLERAAATNPYGYLLKPFSERELHAMIKVTLARCRSEQAARASRECQLQARKMEALGQLAAGVADNFYELLTVVYNQLEILGDPALDRPAMAEPVQDGFRDAIRNERLLHRLLAFSGRQKLTPAAVSVRDLVTKMEAELRRASGGSATLRLMLPDDLWSAWIDAGPLARALMNLATNAFEAMTGGGSQEEGGSLTIEARNSVLEQDHADGQAEVAAGRYVVLVVTDTGAGMPRDVLERAFEPFFTTKPDGGGTGLGLSLVFGFIRQSGGHISIDSQLGGGTTVRIYLPAATDHSEASDNGASCGDASGGMLAPRGEVPRPAGTPPPRTSGTKPRDREPSPPGVWVASSSAPVLWRNAEAALFATVQAEAGDIRYRLIIEPLPRRDGWDWTVWRPGDAGNASRHGRASSVVSAMAAAEDATRDWHSIQWGSTQARVTQEAMTQGDAAEGDAAQVWYGSRAWEDQRSRCRHWASKPRGSNQRERHCHIISISDLTIIQTNAREITP